MASQPPPPSSSMLSSSMAAACLPACLPAGAARRGEERGRAGRGITARRPWRPLSARRGRQPRLRPHSATLCDRRKDGRADREDAHAPRRQPPHTRCRAAGHAGECSPAGRRRDWLACGRRRDPSPAGSPLCIVGWRWVRWSCEEKGWAGGAGPRFPFPVSSQAWWLILIWKGRLRQVPPLVSPLPLRRRACGRPRGLGLHPPLAGKRSRGRRGPRRGNGHGHGQVPLRKPPKTWLRVFCRTSRSYSALCEAPAHRCHLTGTPVGCCWGKACASNAQNRLSCPRTMSRFKTIR